MISKKEFYKVSISYIYKNGLLCRSKLEMLFAYTVNFSGGGGDLNIATRVQSNNRKIK